MSIWQYGADEPYRLLESEAPLFRENHGMARERTTRDLTCRYCRRGLRTLGSQALGSKGAGEWSQKLLHVCDGCGWWVVVWDQGYAYGSYEGAINLKRGSGLLRTLDPSDISIPLDQLRRYLLARYEDRFKLNPKRFEDIVGGVFSDFDYSVRVTSYSGDKGIDVAVLDSESGGMIGVQVKRYAGKIAPEQIRAFAGALVQNSMTEGVFVTTSSFTPGAVETAAELRQRGTGIELWDADAFYEKLQMSQRPLYEEVEDPAAPFHALWENHESIPAVHSVSW